MKLKFCSGKILALFIFLTTLNSCLSVAKMTDFPNSSANINFDKYSTELNKKKDPFWTLNTSNEYYIERNVLMTEMDLTNLIQYALKKMGYKIYTIDINNDYVFGKRGMYANEWSSITGVYYKIDISNKKLHVYINTKITQDFTGGWRENRAQKVGQIIENMIDSKK